MLKVLCYPSFAKNIPLDILVALARTDGKRISKEGSKVKVVDRVWSKVCRMWVVIVEIKENF